jgi:hypothetical protein
MTPENQLSLFRAALDALGGIRPAARTMGCNHRMLEHLASGRRALHEGWLRDISAALLDRADHCRQLERALSPAFSGNLTTQQRERGLHGNARHRRAGKAEAV